MHFGVVSLFPEMFEPFFKNGIVGKAVGNKLIDYTVSNPRDFTKDIHRTVDDKTYGGGPGMVLKPEPLYDAIENEKLRAPVVSKVVYLTPQGKKLDQKGVEELATNESLIFIAGRYEGIDQRIVELSVDESWSIGDYVISGGELAAMVVIDAITRLIPGALGHPLSAIEDSFSGQGHGLLDCPHYTRPPEFMGKDVPEVLMKGDHNAIKAWRQKAAIEQTMKYRKDLLDIQNQS